MAPTIYVHVHVHSSVLCVDVGNTINYTCKPKVHNSVSMFFEWLSCDAVQSKYVQMRVIVSLYVCHTIQTSLDLLVVS